MQTLLTYLAVIILLLSCGQREQKPIVQKSQKSNELKAYQQYAYTRIRYADNSDQGFTPSDSFYLWPVLDFRKGGLRNRITRTISNGYYRYTFWEHKGDTAFIYTEDSIPITRLLKDTMFDINGDKVRDFIATFKASSVTDSSFDTKSYILDTVQNRFIKVSN